MHHLNEHNLRRAFHSLDGTKASGIDRVTTDDYRQHLDSNLQALEQRLRDGWRPQPAKEVLIPKPQGWMRPLAVGCLEDKIVQTLVARILEAIYEPSFHRHSYGFRRGKSAHQAPGRAYQCIGRRKKSCVVVEMDIEKFFDSVDQQWLLRTLGQRIGVPLFLQLLARMLRCSTLHADGTMADNLAGTPQGLQASPILANVCLHVLLDQWFEQRWASRGEFIRCADDASFVFSDQETAHSFQQALSERMAEAGLRLNLDKTRIVPFSAKASKGAITLLGFELYWGIKPGVCKCLEGKTTPKRLGRAVQSFTEWIKSVRARKTTADSWCEAAAKLTGHFRYYGVSFNEAKLHHFRWPCIGALFRWLNRRSQKRSFTWELPAASAVGSSAAPALRSRTDRHLLRAWCFEEPQTEEPYAQIGHVRFCEEH